MTTRVVLVTGATRGIGRAIASSFIEDGFDVVTSARQPPSEELPSGPSFVACDVAHPGQVTKLFSNIRERYGRLDVLVNNAGLAGANSLDPEGDDGQWKNIVDTNLNGTYYCCKAAIPLLPDRSGRIINIASVLGLKGIADQTAYCAAKHGVVGFTRALAHELASPRRITVNAICPGWVDTDMAAQRFRELGITATDAGSETPTGRITQPTEIAALVRFLVQTAAGNLTGQAIVVDGGSLA